MSRPSYHYVYILESMDTPRSHFYTGFTDQDPAKRLKEHNAGTCVHTAKYRPWRLKTVMGFADRKQALAFERYLKSPSGRAFARKRL